MVIYFSTQQLFPEILFSFSASLLLSFFLNSKFYSMLLFSEILWIIYNNLLKITCLLQKKVQFSSIAQSCLTLCDPRKCSMSGFAVYHQFPELIQTHVHQVGDAIQPSHPLSSTSPPAFSLSQHQGLFKWVNSLHQVAKVLELQHQSFQWIFSTDFL